MIVEVQLNISFGCKPIGLLLLEGFLFKDFSFLLKEEGFLFKELLGTICEHLILIVFSIFSGKITFETWKSDNILYSNSSTLASCHPIKEKEEYKKNDKL